LTLGIIMRKKIDYLTIQGAVTIEFAIYLFQMVENTRDNCIGHNWSF